ncbi:MAG: hypothetical protein KIY10_10500 [Thermoplasmata archaeon]|nr:hypothetical protein [Candidatus Sysuiplasma jiujiangense]
MNFDEWLKREMEKLDKIREALKEKHGTVDRDYQEWLFEDAKEPWGFTRKEIQDSGTAERTGNGNQASGGKPAPDSSITEIMAKWDLVDDNGKLKPRKFLKEGFADLAKELEQHGYKYNKNAGGFLPAWKGVNK